jgi:hypothetical protein
MPQSHTQLYAHLIFSTKERQPILAWELPDDNGASALEAGIQPALLYAKPPWAMCPRLR